MKTSLSHLPRYKQEKIRQIRDLILAREKRVEMIILFGSYARGTWVEDYQMEEGHGVSYISDYDILVVTTSRKAAESSDAWREIKERWIRIHGDEAYPQIIAHDIHYLNKQLEVKQYFFTDIKREGIMLYDSGNFKLARRRKLDMPEVRKLAKDSFNVWFRSAKNFLMSYNFLLGKKEYKTAAFMLHQAAENASHALSMVFTAKKPKCHDLGKLGGSAARHSIKFKAVFPVDTPERKRLFELLVRAYIEARYSKYYVVEKWELEYLAARVETLMALVETRCKDKLRQMASE